MLLDEFDDLVGQGNLGSQTLYFIFFSRLLSRDGEPLIDNAAQIGRQDAGGFFLIDGGDILEFICNLSQLFSKILIDDLLIDAWLNPFFHSVLLLG